MNVEKLHEILSDVNQEIEKSQLISLFQNLISSLQNLINQPNQSSYQQQISNTLTQIEPNLNKMKINTYSPAWKQILNELEINDILGENLMISIKNIFSENKITPSVASQKLNEIFTRLNNLKKSIDQFLNGCTGLKIAKDILKPGECEIGILIPRKAIKNNIENLSKELHEINYIFGVFEEIITTKRTDLKIRTIATTDPTFFFDMLPEIAACIAVTIERIVALYKSLLEIRKLKKDLEEQGLDEEELEGINKHANNKIKDGIEELIPEIISNYCKTTDTGRKNEIENLLRIAMKKIANRIDKGYNFEIRVIPLKTTEKEQTLNDSNIKNSIELILQKSQGLSYIKLTGEPILSLPESADDKKTKKEK